MTTINITETSRPPQVAVSNLGNELWAVIGATASTESETPAVGTPVRVRSAVEAAVFGDYTDGTLPQALELIYDEVPNADLIAIRHDDGTTLTIDNAITTIIPTIERLFGRRVTGIILQDDTWNTGAGGAIDNSARNDHVTALEQMAERLGCLFVASAPDGTVAESIAWAARNTNSRMIAAYPRVRPTGETTLTNPAAAIGAAVLSARLNRGYWANPNFTALRSVAAVEREIYFNPRDAASDSRQLAAANIVTILDARQSGWRMYGSNLNSTGVGDDEKREIKIRTTLDRLEVFAEDLALQYSSEDTTSITIDSFISQLTAETNRLQAIRALRHAAAYLDPTVPLSMQLATGQISLVLEANGVRSLRQINLNIVT